MYSIESFSEDREILILLRTPELDVTRVEL